MDDTNNLSNTSISTGSVVVTHNKLHTSNIDSGSVVVASDSVRVRGDIENGAVVMSLGPVKARKIHSGASVISDKKITADSVGVSAGLISAPEMNIRGRDWERKRVSFIQAITDPDVKGKLERKFDVNIDEYVNNGIKSLPELIDSR